MTDTNDEEPDFPRHIASQFREKAKELRRHAAAGRGGRGALLAWAHDFDVLADVYEERLRAKAHSRPTA